MLMVSGCVPVNQEELERLTKEDPSFAQMIASRDQAYAQIQLIKQDLLSKKKVLNAQTEKLQSDYEAYARLQSQKIDQFRATIASRRAVLQKDIDTAQQQLDVKQKELALCQNTLTNIRRLLNESKGVQLSSKERRNWEERAVVQAEKTKVLADEVQELKLYIRLKKQKASFLQ